jgi:Ni,Fe-hydrogenase III large subunit/Ni,Fe-hydrogenase III component G
MDTGSICTRYAVPFTSSSGDGVPLWIAEVDAQSWLRVAQQVRDEGARLVSIWGTDRRPLAHHELVSAAYCVPEGLLWLRLPASQSAGYPDLSTIFPAAARMQRALFDLLGIAAHGAPDRRPWLNHGRWPDSYFPLLRQHSGKEQFDSALKEYPFVQVAGDGVHEIAVGPIHAGVIEPGHFRFSVVGEKVLRLEQRLGYAHKGIDKLFIGRATADGARLAGRVSGDSTVAFAWAYCMALENASNANVPPRAAWLRALLLERERVANHLGDIGALGNDAGLAVCLSQFSRLKEDWVRLSHCLFGHRFMMDCIVPGGVSVDIDDAGAAQLLAQCAAVETQVQTLRSIYEGHAGLQDRFIGTGRVAPKLAAELGMCGLAGRASGQSFDARADQAVMPYTDLDVQMATHRNGDVAARVTLRFEEIAESMRLLHAIASELPRGPVLENVPETSVGALGAGWVEGWRGPVFVALEIESAGKILRCECHDPSWSNWPALQHAIMGNIVPDFPLINKSFNLSYSGHDR